MAVHKERDMNDKIKTDDDSTELTDKELEQFSGGIVGPIGCTNPPPITDLNRPTAQGRVPSDPVFNPERQ